MNSSSSNEAIIELKKKENLTFSFFIAIWFIFSLPFGGFFYYLALYSKPNPNLSGFITYFLLFLFSQNLVIPFIIMLLPFSPIDYSINSLKRSFFHKVFFFMYYSITFS